MGYDGYMAFNGTEVVNSVRTASYVNNYGFAFVIACSQCQGAAAGPYYDPVTDGAPWVDPAVPWSKDFLGFFGITVGGVTAATGSRSPLAKVGDGAVIGQMKHAQRELNVHAMGFALSEQGMSWGQSWLSSVLQAGSGIPSCGTPCSGVAISVKAWCPNCTDDAAACAAANRSLFQSAILQGPEFTNKVQIGQSCGRGRPWMWDTDFLLGAGLPFAFQDPVVVATQVPFTVPVLWPCVTWQSHTPGSGVCTLPDCSTNVFASCMTWTPATDPSCDDPCGSGDGNCLLNDPLCPAPTAPTPPARPNDPCLCVISMNPVTTMTNIPASTLPRTAAFVPILQVNAGVIKDMRRILLRFYRASAGEVCTYANLGTCDVMGEIGIPYLPAGSTLLIDGRQQVAIVTCADGRTETPILYTSDGPMAKWPVLGCSDAWCVAVTADADNVGSDAWASVSVAVRDDVW